MLYTFFQFVTVTDTVVPILAQFNNGESGLDSECARGMRRP